MKPLPAFVTRCHFFITWKERHSAAAVDGKQYGGLISIQIAARNIRISLDKRLAFWKETYDVSEETRGKANMIPVKRIYLLYLQTRVNLQKGRETEKKTANVQMPRTVGVV